MKQDKMLSRSWGFFPEILGDECIFKGAQTGPGGLIQCKSVVKQELDNYHMRFWVQP